MTDRKRKYNLTVYKHGCARDGRRSRIYRIWTGMKARCANSKMPNFKYYGARGIRVCDKWASDFREFLSWAMINGYSETLQIDRIDNDGPYSPENCRWATLSENNNNTRANKLVSAFGEMKSIALWGADSRCVPGVETLRTRIIRGWDPETALSKPAGRCWRWEK